jgi:hypothetical protein
MLVTVEGVPGLFHFPISMLTHQCDAPQVVSAHLLPGNPLDLACHGDTIFVSVDNVHAAGSTTVVDEREVRATSLHRGGAASLHGRQRRLERKRLVAVRLDEEDEDEGTERVDEILEEANGLPLEEGWDPRERDEVLYWAERLRKHDGQDED